MKRPFPAVLRYFSMIAVAAACAYGVPINCSASGSFATLLASNAEGGCYVGDALFSDFTFQSSATGTALALAADQFSYTIVTNAPVAIGFQFAGAIGALENSSMTLNIGWIVTGREIRSDHLSFTASAFGSATARIDETYCRGGAVNGCAPENTGQLSVFTGENLTTKLADAALFTPLTILGVAKTITVTAGPVSFANISNITQTADQLPEVPEPATAAFAASGLLAGWFLFRRRCA